MAMLSKLIEATGHQLTFNVEPLPGRRLGLPDTPLGRRLRRHRRCGNRNGNCNQPSTPLRVVHARSIQEFHAKPLLKPSSLN